MSAQQARENGVNRFLRLFSFPWSGVFSFRLLQGTAVLKGDIIFVERIKT